MSVEILVPWRDVGCPHRRAALDWVVSRLLAAGWQTSVVADGSHGPWVKANVVMPAIERSTADVVIVHDADVWVSDGLQGAVKALRAGFAWSVPHRAVNRLTAASTAAVLAGAEPDDGDLEEVPYLGVAAGGVVAVRRDVALDTPMDPRFEGWGGEDHAWGFALHGLHGVPWRGDAPLWHLWHPPQPRVDRKVGSHRSEQLRRRYLMAALEPEMRAIVEEAKAWRRSSTFA